MLTDLEFGDWAKEDVAAVQRCGRARDIEGKEPAIILRCNRSKKGAFLGHAWVGEGEGNWSWTKTPNRRSTCPNGRSSSPMTIAAPADCVAGRTSAASLACLWLVGLGLGVFGLGGLPGISLGKNDNAGARETRPAIRSSCLPSRRPVRCRRVGGCCIKAVRVSVHAARGLATRQGLGAVRESHGSRRGGSIHAARVESCAAGGPAARQPGERAAAWLDS